MKLKLTEEDRDEWRAFLLSDAGKEAYLKVLAQVEQVLIESFLSIPTNVGSEKLFVEKAKLEGATKALRMMRDVRTELVKE